MLGPTWISLAGIVGFVVITLWLCWNDYRRGRKARSRKRWMENNPEDVGEGM